MKSFLLIFSALAAVFSHPNPDTYDAKKAFEQVLFAGIAYCPSADIEQWNCQICSVMLRPKNITVVQDTLLWVQAYLARIDDAIIIAFRGTEPSYLRNWILDLDAIKAQYPDNEEKSLVHKGFLDAYKSLSPEIMKYVAAHSDAVHVSITGHSLGGAMATLCHVDLARAFPPLKLALYTFGSPRVGNDYFVDIANRSGTISWRVVHKRDVVTQIPFMFMGFSHVGSEVWYDTEDTLVMCGKGENKNCSVGNIWLSMGDHSTYLNVTVGGLC